MINAVIFDMDGLLVDSEPIWHEAADLIFRESNINLTKEQYNSTIGLRTIDFVTHWVKYFNLEVDINEMVDKIYDAVVLLCKNKLELKEGVIECLELVKGNYKIGLATSSATVLIDTVLEKFDLKKYFKFIASGHFLEKSKPHPEVYLNCAKGLNAIPTECVAFEDSYNGMIAAKAARMKCILVPDIAQQNDKRWFAADIILHSLILFNLDHLNDL